MKIVLNYNLTLQQKKNLLTQLWYSCVCNAVPVPILIKIGIGVYDPTPAASPDESISSEVRVSRYFEVLLTTLNAPESKPTGNPPPYC